MIPVVLDASGLESMVADESSHWWRSLLRAAVADDRPVLLPSVVCAEVCRGKARTRAVEAFVARHRAPSREARVSLVDTDFALARQVGAVLDGAGSDSSLLVDAHVVAACLPYGGGVVITSDPDDIRVLAAGTPLLHVVTRSPNRP